MTQQAPTKGLPFGQWVPWMLLLCFGGMLYLSLSSPGTWDSGDSIMHYQIARYAFVHPENFLSHWGKPIFVLLAAPFAQMGFAGMKLMQCLLGLGTGFVVWQSAKALGRQHAGIAPLLVIAAPAFILSQLSGLTEPLFAFNLALGCYLFLTQKPGWAAVVLSFLPFVRTEGFFLLPAFALYLMWQRNWSRVPLLATGTLLYMVIGWLVKGNPLWIWTENPYVNKVSSYGSGEWLHFIGQYTYISGIPIYVLTALGLMSLVVKLARRKLSQWVEWMLVVVAPFCIYIALHSYLWAMGEGHSMGLNRVLIAVLPLGALVGTLGLDALLGLLPWEKVRSLAGLLIVGYLLAFPFVPNPAALKGEDFELTSDQQLIGKAAEWMRSHQLLDRKLYATHPSAAWMTGIDPFDPAHYRTMHRLKDDGTAPGIIVLYDGWFGKVESGYPISYFADDSASWRELQRWEGMDGDTPLLVALFEHR